MKASLILLSLSSAVMGSNICPTPEHNGDIASHSEFSYINTKGNSNVESLAFEGNAKSRWDLHIFRAHADAYRSTVNGAVSKSKWSTELNYDYQFDEIISTNYMIGYKEDRFSRFDYQFYTGPGLGWKVIDGTSEKLSLQGNLLFAEDKPQEQPVDDYFSSKIGAEYQWKIQDNLKFIQEATYRVNLEQPKYWFVYSKTAIESKINSTLSMGVSYKLDYVNTPPPSTLSRTDKTFMVSLIVDY